MSQVIIPVADYIGDIQLNELRRDIQQWISPPNPSVNYNAACDAHHEGTMAWCTQSDTFARWTASGSLLWIHGKPGSGKSVLSSVIIRDIKAISDSDARPACVAYFYFDFKDTGKQDLRALSSSLLIQLSNQSNRLFDVLYWLYKKHRRPNEPSNDSLVESLKSMLMISEDPIYLVLDALDECPKDSGAPSSREKVLALVKDLVELRLPNMHLCIISRPESDIRTSLEPLAPYQLSLPDESGHKKDIIDYVTFVVHSDQRMKGWRDDDKDWAIEKLTEKADGIFQLIFYQLDVLRHCSTDVRRVLEESPKSLDETYERILKGVDKANREHAYRLLQCLTVAVRPLQVEELAGALAFDFTMGGLPKLNADWRWEDQGEAALLACSHLVSVISDNGSRVVQLSHSSVKEFITPDRLASSTEEVSQFHILMEPSHAALAKACLGVLLRLDDRTNKKSFAQIPLARYAGQYWVRHARIGDVESQIVDAMDYFLDMDKPHFVAWVRILYQNDLLKHAPEDPLERMKAMPHPAAPLYFAVDRGFRGPVERLVVKYPQQVNALGSEFGTPLHAAVLQGRIEVAQLLVAHGADIDSRSAITHLFASERTPLHVASEEGRLEVAEWLLDSGADVNAHDDNQNTPIHSAATRGRLELVRMLLKRGAKVEARGFRGCPPFFSAVRGGNLDVVHLLLENGADAYACDDDGNSALHIAVRHDHLEVAQMLLARNLEVNARNNNGSSPLDRALLVSRNPDVVRLLLDHGADTDGCDIEGWSTLRCAVGSGNPEIVQMILERKPTIEARDNRGVTPLMAASYNVYPAVVRLLLDHGADPHARDYNGETAIDYGASLAACRMLLKLNVSHSTAFHRASASGDPDLMRLLLDHGADAGKLNEDGFTALQFAATTGGIGAVRFLVLELNADVNVRDEDGWTPLHRASEGWEKRSAEVVQFLLENGADVQARNNCGQTAYEVAGGEEMEEIQELLSKHATAVA